MILVISSEAHERRYNSDKQNGMVEDLELFQTRKQVFLKQCLKQKFGVHFPPISIRTRLCCLTRGVPIICILFLDLLRLKQPIYRSNFICPI